MRQVVVRRVKSGEICVLRSDAALLGKLADLISEAIGRGRGKVSLSDLTDIGLSCSEVADLEIREPIASEIAEYAGALGGKPSDLLTAAETVLGWHVQDIDREVNMLLLHRRALERKMKAIRHLMCVIFEDHEAPQAI